MISSKIKLIFTILVLMMLFASSNAHSTNHKLNGSYGTLKYSGSVSVKTNKDSVIYIVEELTLTFDPNAEINSVTQISSPTIRIITSKMGVNNQKGKIIYEARIPTKIYLDSNNRVVTLNNLVFSIPKDGFDGADYVGFALIEKLIWPMHLNLIK